MTYENTPRTDHPITQDMPLPGFYPCLTLQLNITRYASERLGRSVLVVREPSAGLEVQRLIVPQQEWQELVSGARIQVEQALRNMAWLQDGEKG